MGRSDEILSSYATRLWDAGNLVVTLIYALAFGVYLVIAGKPDVFDEYITKYFWYLVVISAIGNLGLLVLIKRLQHHEIGVAGLVCGDPILLDAIKSAMHIRVVLIVANFAMYISVLAVVALF